MSQPLRISFINMPFGELTLPSLGYAKLEQILKKTFGDKVQVDTLYLNMDYALHVGDLSLYNHALSDYGFLTDVGDWLFRQAAFPESPDNADEYFARYYYEKSPEMEKVRVFLQDQRAKLAEVLDGFIDKYNLLDADIVGFTLVYSQSVSSFALARRIKDRKPSVTTIIGGPKCEGEMGRVLAERMAQVDYVFSGEALVSLPEFVTHRLSGDIAKCDSIDGVLSRSNRFAWQPDSDDRLCRSGDRQTGIATRGRNLPINTNIIPDYNQFLDVIEKKFPNGRIKPVLLFDTSRGCPRAASNPCRFCGLNGEFKTCDVMTVENALGQIKAICAYAPRAKYFVNVDNVLPANYIREVFPLLPQRSDIAIRYEVFSNITASDMQTLCRAGVTRCQPGLESLSNSTLTLMRKGTTSFRNLQFLKDCTRYPFTPEWNLLINIPGEKESVYDKYLSDIPLLTHLPPPIGFFPIMFVRFSDYYLHQAENGIQLQPQDFYKLIFPFSSVDIERVACFFRDAKVDSDRVDGWLVRLNRAAQFWQTRWYNRDGKIQSRLCFLENSDVVYDSRSGAVVEHKLTSLMKCMLDLLENPFSRAEVMSRCHDTAGLGADHEFELLIARGLLFEDNGKYLSLVAG